MTRLTRVAAIAAVALAAVPSVAAAHVTLQPEEAPAGGFARLDVRVPTERDDASTTKVVVRFPGGFVFASTEPVPGWTSTIKMRKLASPIEVEGEERTEEVDTVTFTTKGKGIGPGQFQDFGLSLGLPHKPDTSLTFKAIQTYSSGETVRWIGAPDADQPAPQVKLTAAAAEGDAAAAPAPSGEGGDDEDEEETDTLAIIALVVGGLGLLAGLAALAAARRARPVT